jgi:hypothetical protein
MRKPRVVLFACLASMALIIGATDLLAEEAESPPAAQETGRLLSPAQGNLAGKVIQTMDVSQYTYVEIDTGKGLAWVAGPLTKVTVGDTVEATNGIQMVDFHSTTLDRTFDEIHLVSAIRVKSNQTGDLGNTPGSGDAGVDAKVTTD